MGCGMNLITVLKAGINGIAYTLTGIALAIALGVFIGKKLKLPRDTTFLTSIGTAICGGSAIAATAPVLQAKSHDIAISMATVFILNAVALLAFPWIGHYCHLTEPQFGLWAALAIHDTSSVVGASFQYGPTALEVGTTVKLARALWIVPVTLALAYYLRRRHPEENTRIKAKFPWFIPGFIAAAALVTYLPGLAPAGAAVKNIAQNLMIVTLFFIGCNLNRDKLKNLGVRPFLHGVILWIVVSAVWLTAIKIGLGS